ncbi:MAG TPA: hypothetical protein VJQ56_11160 [Blastocatellia bacterium]|nr:hypothetical protein [Blastocatellia bacterium]
MMAITVRSLALLFALLATAGCNRSDDTGRASSAGSQAGAKGFKPPVLLGNLEEEAVSESSGIAASRANKDYFWTHNDSGGGPFIYAFNREGKRAGVWQVAAAKARDWEDIAVGPGPQTGRSYIYIGDIGDNGRRRSEIIVYRLPEPRITSESAQSTKTRPARSINADTIRLAYPDGQYDAEALMIHPQTGDLYIITKELLGASKVYKARSPLQTDGVTQLVRVGKVDVPGWMGGFVTGADIAPDGRAVALCDYANGYEIRLPEGQPGGFDAIWKQPLAQIDIGRRKQGEAICYRADGRGLLATSEGRPCPLIEVLRED